MRFQTTETVLTPDSETVLRVLETALPEISSDVVRDGHQIVLRGLGPSPRTRNPRDITILQVSSDHATTVIHADVTFQASALLGTAPQDTVVRSKLDYVFDQVRTQLSLESQRGHSHLVPHSGVLASAADSRSFDSTVVEMPHHGPADRFERAMQPVAKAVPVPAPMPVVEPHVRPEVPLVEPVSAESPRVEPLAEVVAEHEPVTSAPVIEDAPVVADVPVEVRDVEPPVIVEAVAAAPVARVKLAVKPAKPRHERPMLQFGSTRAQRTHVPALIAAIIALLLLFAVAAYYLLRPNPPEFGPTSLEVKTQPVNQSSVGEGSLVLCEQRCFLQVSTHYL